MNPKSLGAEGCLLFGEEMSWTPGQCFYGESDAKLNVRHLSAVIMQAEPNMAYGPQPDSLICSSDGCANIGSIRNAFNKKYPNRFIGPIIGPRNKQDYEPCVYTFLVFLFPASVHSRKIRLFVVFQTQNIKRRKQTKTYRTHQWVPTSQNNWFCIEQLRSGPDWPS